MADRAVTVIPARKTFARASETNVLRVAAYARVSTDSDEQMGSVAAQKDYFEKLIQKNPAWVLVEIYADATDIIGLKKNPTNGRRFSPIFSFIEHFRHKLRKCYFKSKEEN